LNSFLQTSRTTQRATAGFFEILQPSSLKFYSNGDPANRIRYRNGRKIGIVIGPERLDCDREAGLTLGA
jgi:hypothetical protein